MHTCQATKEAEKNGSVHNRTSHQRGFVSSTTQLTHIHISVEELAILVDELEVCGMKLYVAIRLPTC